MKLSIAWIFDHIDADWKDVDIAALVKRFNQVTAEIEGYEKITLALDQFSLVQIRTVSADAVVVYSPEWRQDFTLRFRHDVTQDQFFMVKRQDDLIDWATGRDFNCAKDFLLPAFACPDHVCDGSWKIGFETEDYILELDNKSITHRPDMWGHRGFAREVAALLNLPMKDESEFLLDYPVAQHNYQVAQSPETPFAIIIENSTACKRFAGLYVSYVEAQPSFLWMAYRLLRVDSKPIDAIVDATNYVMLDIGAPMHAFDAAWLPNKTIVARAAKNKEKLTLLDGETVELTAEDFVITDGQNPIALAGVMGGKQTGVSATTRSLFLEAANFDPGVIRKSAQRAKKRTEASARFEKNLDPNLNTQALLRFLHILDHEHITYDLMGPIVSLGTPAQPLVLTITHDFLERRLGVSLAPEFVQNILTQLNFGVVFADGQYTVTVPTARSTKDVTIKEDIVEEVGRFYGYTNITPDLPYKPTELSNVHPIMRVREIKQIMASALSMREVYNYSFFDEEFFNSFPWQPGQTLTVQNPVSENWRRLVTTLIPNIFKNLQQAATEHDQVRFFEWARTWHPGAEHQEKRSLAGIMYVKHDTIDFYDAKDLLATLFNGLHVALEWEKVDNPAYPWFAPYQTAYIVHEGTKIGIAGKANQTFLHTIALGDAFIFELDGDFLLNYKQPIKKFVPLSKYPEVVRDVSMLVPLTVSVHSVEKLILQADAKIISATLMDFFEKAEWGQQRSLTFRFVIRDMEKTLTKQEVDLIADAVNKALQATGAVIR